MAPDVISTDSLSEDTAPTYAPKPLGKVAVVAAAALSLFNATGCLNTVNRSTHTPSPISASAVKYFLAESDQRFEDIDQNLVGCLRYSSMEECDRVAYPKGINDIMKSKLQRLYKDLLEYRNSSRVQDPKLVTQIEIRLRKVITALKKYFGIVVEFPRRPLRRG